MLKTKKKSASMAEQLDKLTIDARKQLKDPTLKAVKIITQGNTLPKLKGKVKRII